MKSQEISSSGSPVAPCRRTDGRTDRGTDMKQLTVAFRSFSSADKN